jgi:hypothetical protein
MNQHSEAWLKFRLKHGWTPWGSFPKDGFPLPMVDAPAAHDEVSHG